MSELSERLRREWSANDAKRDAGLKTPDDIKRFDDIAYGPVPKWNTLDVYRPKQEDGMLPVIVIVHGGGWVYGDKELYQFYGMNLAQRGFAVVNYSYRLAPEHKFPAPVEDLNAVIGWMYRNADTYGLDMKHVFLAGDSAGGHLAALYADICTNPAYAAKYAFEVPEGFVPAALGLNCGAFSPLRVAPDADSDDRILMGDLMSEGGTEEEAALLDTTRHVTSAFPPAFVMSCVGDFCLPQVPDMVAALCRNQVPFICKVYGTRENPLYHVFHVTMQEPMGQLCNEEECAFFRSWM